MNYIDSLLKLCYRPNALIRQENRSLRQTVRQAKPWFPFVYIKKWVNVVAEVFNPSPWQEEAGDLSEFEGSLACKRVPCLKFKKKKASVGTVHL